MREMTGRNEARQAAAIAPGRSGTLFGPVPRRRLAGAVGAVGLLSTVAIALSGCSTAAFSSPVSAGAPPASRVLARASASTPGQDYAQAETLRLNGNCDRAVPLYLHAISKSALYLNAYNGLGQCYQSLGSYDVAFQEFDKAITIDPTNYGLYIARAGVEAVTGNTGAAADDDMEALRLAPAQVPAYVSIANSFSSYADFADAITTFSKAIALVPGNSSLYQQRAGLYVQAQDFGRAYADYQRAIATAPPNGARAAVYSGLSNLYNQQGDLTSALNAIAAAIRLQPGNAHYYIQSAILHQSTGDLQGALHLYDQAIHQVSSRSDAVTAHENKGDVLVTLGRTAEAISEYRKALALATDPNSQSRLKTKIQTTKPAATGRP